MVEIEKINEDDMSESTPVSKNTHTTTSTTTTSSNNRSSTKKTRPSRHDPNMSVAHMLVHGSPESQDRPKTFCSIFGYPIFVAVCFAISLLIFHYAPHDKSRQPRGKFKNMLAPQQQQQQRQQQQQIMMTESRTDQARKTHLDEVISQEEQLDDVTIDKMDDGEL